MQQIGFISGPILIDAVWAPFVFTSDKVSTQDIVTATYEELKVKY